MPHLVHMADHVLTNHMVHILPVDVQLKCNGLYTYTHALIHCSPHTHAHFTHTRAYTTHTHTHSTCTHTLTRAHTYALHMQTSKCAVVLRNTTFQHHMTSVEHSCFKQVSHLSLGICFHGNHWIFFPPVEDPSHCTSQIDYLCILLFVFSWGHFLILWTSRCLVMSPPPSSQSYTRTSRSVRWSTGMATCLNP